MTTTKTSEKKSEPDDNSTVAAVDPTPDMPDVAAAEDTGLVKLAEDNGDHGLVFEANRRELAKLKDEPEADTSKHVVVTIVSPFVSTFTGSHDESSYTITDAAAGNLVPPDAVQPLIEQAARAGVVLSAKAAN